MSKPVLPAPSPLLPAAVLVLGLLTCVPAFAGVIYKIEVKDPRPLLPQKESIEIAVEGRFLKMGIPSGDGVEPDELIYRGTRPEIIFVDHDGRSFKTIERQTLDRIDSHPDQAMAKLQESLKHVPEGNRGQVEQMVKQGLQKSKPPLPPKTELKKTGESSTKNGYSCIKYEVYRGDRKIRELWVTGWSSIEGGSETADTFRKMADLFRRTVSSISRYGQGEPPLDDLALEQLGKLQGFPVVIHELNELDGTVERELTLRSAQRKDLNLEDFKPPNDYSPKEVFATAGLPHRP